MAQCLGVFACHRPFGLEIMVATVRRAERWVLGIAAIVVIVWVVAHLAAVFAAVALLATGRRMLHL